MSEILDFFLPKKQTTKGGHGSGNWGHGGLEGVHGGSSPTKGAGETGDKKLTVNGLGSEYEFVDNKFKNWDYHTSKYVLEPTLSVHSTPTKRTGSVGGWFVHMEREMLDFSGQKRREQSSLKFHYKKDAQKLIDYLKDLDVPEYEDWN